MSATVSANIGGVVVEVNHSSLFDVTPIRCGSAGLMTASRAASAGVSVILTEKLG